MVKEITKDSDVIEVSRREEGQRVLTRNSWMKYVFMLIYFMFSYVTENMIHLYANEGEPVKKLVLVQRKKELKCSILSSMEFEHMLEEPKDMLQT